MITPEELRKKFRKLPKALAPIWNHSAPNESIQLYDGAFCVIAGGEPVACKGQFSFEWFPRPGVRFDGEAIEPAHALLNPGKTGVEVSDLDISGQAFVSRFTHQSDEGRSSLTGSVRHSEWTRDPSGFDPLYFHLANFHTFIGERIRPADPEASELTSWAGRLVFETSEYRLTLDQLRTYKNRQKQVKRSGGYVLGHVGRLDAKDNGLGSPDAVNSALTALHFFFSFCRGMWCSPILSATPVNGDTYATEWKQPLISQWEYVPSWFPRRSPASVPSLLDGFFDKWQDPVWEETLTHVINWYVESNLNAGKLEGSIALAQTALEHLAWVYVVEKKQLKTTREFKNSRQFPAAEKVRLLLDQLDIPVSIPTGNDELKDVVKLLKTEGITVDHGPDLFVQVRNMIIHPRKAKRDRLSLFSGKQKFQVKQLGLAYVELALLRLLGYSGTYYSRLERESLSKMQTQTPW